MEMAWAEQNAITPSLELAKLALVTSKDEEEDEAKLKPQTTATGSTASTDATLVEESASSSLPSTFATAPLASTSTSTHPPSGSVLGKRSREEDMDIEMVDPSSKPRSPRNEGSPPPDKTMRVDGPHDLSADADMVSQQPIKSSENAGDLDVDMNDAEVSSNVATAPASRGSSPAPASQAQALANGSTTPSPPTKKADSV